MGTIIQSVVDSIIAEATSPSVPTHWEYLKVVPKDTDSHGAALRSEFSAQERGPPRPNLFYCLGPHLCPPKITMHPNRIYTTRRSVWLTNLLCVPYGRAVGQEHTNIILENKTVELAA